MDINNYKILKHGNSNKLEEEVNKYLYNGYILNGELKVIYCPIKNETTFFQSIKKIKQTTYHWRDWE